MKTSRRNTGQLEEKNEGYLAGDDRIRKIRYFSIFSGIGGFEYGMEQSRHSFECVGYSEIDKYARQIYERHYPNHPYYGDARLINTKDLPQFDLLVGGFPCQSFSIAGKGRGFDDTRGTLFFEVARILKDKRPRYFLLENVRNLLSHNKGETFKTVIGVLSNLGYNTQWEILNSKNHGVPQNRERIFLKGYLGRECGEEILHQRRSCEENNARISNRKHKPDVIIKGNTSNTGHLGGAVISADGLSSSITSTNYKHPIQILEKDVIEYEKEKE